jgi:hypothetical protein
MISWVFRYGSVKKRYGRSGAEASRGLLAKGSFQMYAATTTILRNESNFGGGLAGWQSRASSQ